MSTATFPSRPLRYISSDIITLQHRLKVLQGSQFVYLLRGLPKTASLEREALAVGWGPVQLVFPGTTDLELFLGALRHVDIHEDRLWPARISMMWTGRPAHDQGTHLAWQAVPSLISLAACGATHMPLPHMHTKMTPIASLLD